MLQPLPLCKILMTRKKKLKLTEYKAVDPDRIRIQWVGVSGFRNPYGIQGEICLKFIIEKKFSLKTCYNTK
jgi:hypothetical protein